MPDTPKHTLATERWLPVVGYEGFYEVSDLGRVRSIDRVVFRHGDLNRPVRWRGRVLAFSKDHKGYLVVGLCRDGKAKNRYVHQLVLMTFVGPRPDGLHACHQNGNHLDNCPGNLRWDTLLENNRDIIRHGKHNNASRPDCRRGHLLIAPNLCRRKSSRPNARDCLACTKARSYRGWLRRKKGVVVDLDMMAARYYAEIMGSEAV